MIFRVLIDFTKLIGAANGIIDASEKEKRLKFLYDHMDKDILVKADSMTAAMDKIHEFFDCDPISIDRTNLVVL